MKTTLILLAAITAPQQPFIDAISPETSQLIVDYIISGKSYKWLDYNCDGEMNLADAVGVLHKYETNVRNGNELTLDLETIYDIGWENLSSNMDRIDFIENELLYYEIERVNGELCKRYDLTVTEKSEAVIYYEFEDYADTVTVSIDPITEVIRVQ